MDTAKGHVRNGLGTVRPYIYGPESLVTFVERAFGGEVVERSPDGGEVEIRIGDSKIALALGEQFPDGVATRASIYVYVTDADATFALAVSAGAIEISPPRTTPYQERIGGVRDMFGNVWYVSTYLGDS